MTKELKKQESQELVNTNQALADSGISTNDLLISRVGIMNALSQLVKDGEAKIGDIMDTGAEEKLGDDKTPVGFIVLKSFKYWHVEKDKEYVKNSRTPANNQNEKPWDEPGGIKNIFNHSFYILLQKDVEDGMILPYTLNFKSTEIKKAKRICNVLYRMAQKGIPSYGNYFELLTKEERNGKNSWMGAKINVGGAVPAPIQEKAKELLMMLNKAEAEGKVQHAEENETLQDDGEY